MSRCENEQSRIRSFLSKDSEMYLQWDNDGTVLYTLPKDGSKVMEAHISAKAKTNTHGVGEGEGEATSTQTQQAGRPVRTARPWYLVKFDVHYDIFR